MSNGNRWTSSKGYVATDEEATRAVDRSQLAPSTSITDIRDHTVVFAQEDHSLQDKTRALDFDEFQHATQALDLNEDETRALPRNAFEFQNLTPHAPVQRQPFPTPTPSTNQPTTPSPQISTHSARHSADWPSAGQQPVNSYPSPQPSPQISSSISSYGTTDHSPSVHSVSTPSPYPQSSSLHTRVAQQNLVSDSYPLESTHNSIPSPHPSVSSTSPQRPESTPYTHESISTHADLDSSIHGNDSSFISPISSINAATEAHKESQTHGIKDEYSAEDLTQAHLNSQALQEVITSHRYNVTHGQHTSSNQQQSRKKRSKTIIFSTVSLGISLIIAALVYNHFSGSPNIPAYIQRLNISIPQLTAQYAIAWSEKERDSTQPLNSDILHIIFSQRTLLLDQLNSGYSSQVDFSKAELVSQPHPLRLSGAFLNKLSTHITTAWSANNIKEGQVVTNQSERSGVILDILTTLSVVSQRKGKQVRHFSLIVEKKSQKTIDQASTLVKLPFQLLTDQKQLNTQSFLKVSWSNDQNQILLAAPRRHKNRHFNIQRRTSSEDENDVRKDFLDVIESTGGLKGVLISPPRYISIAELSLWLSVSAPYPIYLIPPEASSI